MDSSLRGEQTTKREVKITTSEPLPGDVPGEVFIKDRESLAQAAQQLSGKKMPILGKNNTPTGRYVENIRQKGPYLVGDADLADDEYISIHYKADEADVKAVLQSNITLFNAYLTDTPRFAAQKADSLPEVKPTMSQPQNTVISPPGTIPAPAAPPTPPAQPAAPAPAPTAPAVDQDLDGTREIRESLAREGLKVKINDLRARKVDESVLKELEAMPLKDAFKQIQFLQRSVPMPNAVPSPAPASAPLAQGSTVPVPVPTNANDFSPRGNIDKVLGIPFTTISVTKEDGTVVSSAKSFNPRDLVGRDRIKPQRPPGR